MMLSDRPIKQFFDASSQTNLTEVKSTTGFGLEQRSARLHRSSQQRQTRQTTSNSTLFYNGSGLPQQQSWLAFQQLPMPAPQDLPPYFSQKAKAASQITSPQGVTLDTQIFTSPFSGSTTANTGYAGYSNYTVNPTTLAPKLVNAATPTLNRTTGFQVAFRLAIQSETSATNRAGFNVSVISSDGKAIELGFKSNQIFAQSNRFTAAENVRPAFNLSHSTDYKLVVQGDRYRLLANNSQILTGALRTYQFNPNTSQPRLPFNPYQLPNLVFFGDNTDQGRSQVTLGAIAVTRGL
jgi:hypothetical protein